MSDMQADHSKKMSEANTEENDARSSIASTKSGIDDCEKETAQLKAPGVANEAKLTSLGKEQSDLVKSLIKNKDNANKYMEKVIAKSKKLETKVAALEKRMAEANSKLK